MPEHEQKDMSGRLFRSGERQGDKYISIRFRAAEDGRERTPRSPVADSDLPF
jgi:hypothetical protein